MKKIELKSRKLLRAIFGGISLTAIAFIFQACYGPGPDMFYDVKLTGTVKSKTTNLPVKGIKITVNNVLNYGITDEDGKFNFYAQVPDTDYYSEGLRYTPDSVRVHFLDIDGVENGLFSDTTIIINPAHKKEVMVNIEIEEKQ